MTVAMSGRDAFDGHIALLREVINFGEHTSS